MSIEKIRRNKVRNERRIREKLKMKISLTEAMKENQLIRFAPAYRIPDERNIS